MLVFFWPFCTSYKCHEVRWWNSPQVNGFVIFLVPPSHNCLSGIFLLVVLLTTAATAVPAAAAAATAAAAACLHGVVALVRRPHKKHFQLPALYSLPLPSPAPSQPHYRSWDLPHYPILPHFPSHPCSCFQSFTFSQTPSTRAHVYNLCSITHLHTRAVPFLHNAPSTTHLALLSPSLWAFWVQGVRKLHWH